MNRVIDMTEKLDLHHNRTRIENYEKKIKSSLEITEYNKEKLLEFIRDALGIGFGKGTFQLATLVNYLKVTFPFMIALGKNYHEATKEEVKVYSFSTLNYYRFCPFRYFIIKEINLKFPTREYFIIGSNVHAILQYIHRQAMKGIIIDDNELRNAISKYWKNIEDKRIPNEKLKNSTEKMLLNYIKKFSKTFPYIKDVEKEFWNIFENGIFTGRIDLLREIGGDLEVIDFKTGTVEALDHEEQLKTYLMGLKYGFDMNTNRAIIHNKPIA